jgi:excisionase family DNA binding protein
VTGPLLTTRQVGDLLGLSPATVLRRWRAGDLPGYRIASNVLRFDRGELEAWLEARHPNPSEMRMPAEAGSSGGMRGGEHGREYTPAAAGT